MNLVDHIKRVRERLGLDVSVVRDSDAWTGK